MPLVDAERCWAYAMQLKSEANTEPRKRFHMVSRLKKAVGHAEVLGALCENDKCDARTKLEAQVCCDSTAVGVYQTNLTLVFSLVLFKLLWNFLSMN